MPIQNKLVLTNTMLTIILIIVTVIAIAIISLIVLLVIKKRKPKSKIKVDEEFINAIVSYYGGINNIESVSVDNARLKVLVKDLDLVSLEDLKSNSEAGVFVTGSTIKTLFKFDSMLIKSSIEKKL